jgi:hypothetical protein
MAKSRKQIGRGRRVASEYQTKRDRPVDRRGEESGWEGQPQTRGASAWPLKTLSGRGVWVRRTEVGNRICGPSRSG